MNLLPSVPTDWASLHLAFKEMASSGNAEVREGGEWLAELATFRWEIRPDGKNPLLHLWSDDCNYTRRLLDIKERTPDRIVLEVQRFGRAKPARLEIVRILSARTPVRVARERFRSAMRRVLAESFPDGDLESLTCVPDLKHSLSGIYARGAMVEGKSQWAVFAVRPGESSVTVRDSLTFGILWLDWVRSHATRYPIQGLRLILPEGASGLMLERALSFSPAARIEIYELREFDGRLRKVDPVDVGNRDSWLITRGEMESLLNQARASIARIHALSPHLPPAGDEIGTLVAPGGTEVSLCFRGLEFGRWSREGLFFGIDGERRLLTKLNEAALDRLMSQLDFHRTPLAEDTKHRFYRASPERWIEMLIMSDPTRLDAQLDPKHLYSQVPAVASERGVLDLLGVTRRGRLVVIELKAAENIQTPIQAVDYWLRIRRHQLAGDFERNGFFAGITLQPDPPSLWLVAPGLHFHPATDILLKYLSPEIQITRIGLAENWRRGLKVIFRQ